MKQNLGIGDNVSFSVGKAKPKKEPLIKLFIKKIFYIPVRIVQKIRRKINDEEHPVNFS